MKSEYAALLNMLFCAGGIYACFFYWSAIQERIVTKPYMVEGEPTKFKSSQFLSVVQSVCAMLTSAVVVLLGSLTGTSGNKLGLNDIPWLQLMCIGASVAIGPQFGFAAMQRLSFPTVLTVKMSKMIPILFVGFFWHRHRYPLEKVLNVLAITSGVVGMVLLAEEKHGMPERASSWFGVVLCAINLIFDGYTNSTQDAIAKRTGMTGMQMMLGTNTIVVCWSVVYLSLMEYLSGVEVDPFLAPYIRAEWTEVTTFFSAAPEALYDVITMGTLGAAGQFFIFRAIGAFGSLTMTTLTLTRKVGSVFISIYANDHELVPGQWISLTLVVVGVVMDAYFNIREKKHHHHHHHEHQHHPSDAFIAPRVLLGPEPVKLNPLDSKKTQ